VKELKKREEDKESENSVKTLPPLVKFDLHLDSLRTCLEEIHTAVNDHAQALTHLQKDIKFKAYEKTMAAYFKKIAEGLHKECGERPHAYRIEEHNFLADNYLTEDSVLLKGGAEKLIEKVEVIGLNLIGAQRFKTEAGDRLEKTEKQLPRFFTRDEFREQSQQQESRLLKYIDEQLGNF